jgi:hypothetical protein
MNASEEYQRKLHEHREAGRKGSQDDREKTGKHLREAALERANRREWAHKRRGDESRWTE